LISQAGPQLNIAVVVYAQAVLVDQLFNINLRDGIDVDEQVLALARLGTCLTNTWADLSQYYNGLLQATAPVSPLVTSALHLPAPTSATPSHSLLCDDLSLKFLYKLSCITGAPLNPDDETDQWMNTRHAVFVALGGGIRGIPTEEVVVKFTKRYNMTAHTKLAALGLAPQLYYHAAVRGGLLMMVMEKIVGSTAFRWLWLNNTTHLPSSIYTDVDTAIKALHSADLVFGDLRLPNIMIRVGERDDNGGSSKAQGHGYADASPRSDRGSMDTGSRGAASKSSSSNTREHDGKPADSDSGGINVHALLIDFDWAAEDGVGRYPATISTSDEWAPTVVPFGLMHKAHDLYCLDLLRQKCN
jgi:serine/threonine protein kinase